MGDSCAFPDCAVCAARRRNGRSQHALRGRSSVQFLCSYACVGFRQSLGGIKLFRPSLLPRHDDAPADGHADGRLQHDEARRAVAELQHTVSVVQPALRGHIQPGSITSISGSIPWTLRSNRRSCGDRPDVSESLPKADSNHRPCARLLRSFSQFPHRSAWPTCASSCLKNRSDVRRSTIAPQSGP